MLLACKVLSGRKENECVRSWGKDREGRTCVDYGRRQRVGVCVNMLSTSEVIRTSCDVSLGKCILTRKALGAHMQCTGLSMRGPYCARNTGKRRSKQQAIPINRGAPSESTPPAVCPIATVVVTCPDSRTSLSDVTPMTLHFGASECC